MQTTAHGDHLVQLTRFPRVFPVNVYLVREADGLTLVDTGVPGGARDVLAAAADLDAPIVRIALTHAHSDHVGGLDGLRKALPQVEVAISARDARFLAGDKSIDPDEPQGKPRGGFPKTKTQPTRLLHVGDRVGSLEVVAAAGHTPGQVAFLDTRDGTLIAGDAFQTRAGLAVSGVIRPLFPFPAFFTWDKPTALRSAEKLRALAPARLAVGHGPVLTAPLPELDRALAAARRAFGEVGAEEADRVASGGA